MIQINNIEEITKENIPKLLLMAEPVLRKRQELYNRLNRKADDSAVFYSINNNKTKIPFEQFIVSVASGYLAGKAPIYSVDDSNTPEKEKLIEELLDKKPKEENNKEMLEILIDYITKYNDDGAEHFRLTKDALSLCACYEIIWEDKDNEIRYKNYDPLQTVAIRDYTVDKNVIGLLRRYYVKDVNNTTSIMVEIIDKNGTKTFDVSNDYKEVKELDVDDHQWDTVPATIYESDFSVFETVVDLIKAFEQVIQNNRNTFEYNDTGAKLKVKGYSPDNPAFEEKEIDGKIVRIPNEARLMEDKFVLESKVFYLGEDGDIDWITKDINDTATQNTIKTYMELITMMSCVPNITDTGFTNADNNSAIKNKYFALSQKLIELKQGFLSMYKKRWEIILDRKNKAKNKNFDFRDIKIELPVNIPTNEQEEIDNTLKLKDVLSDETIITKLGFNYEAEKDRLDEEAKTNFEENMKNMQEFGNNPIKQKEDNNDINEDLSNNNNFNNDINNNKAKKDKE